MTVPPQTTRYVWFVRQYFATDSNQIFNACPFARTMTQLRTVLIIANTNTNDIKQVTECATLHPYVFRGMLASRCQSIDTSEAVMEMIVIEMPLRVYWHEVGHIFVPTGKCYAFKGWTPVPYLLIFVVINYRNFWNVVPTLHSVNISEWFHM